MRSSPPRCSPARRRWPRWSCCCAATTAACCSARAELAIRRGSAVVAPQARATGEAGAVVDDADVGRQRAVEPARVAAADVEVVEPRQLTQVVDRAQHTLLPLVVADLLARRVAELLVVRLALAERLVRDLEMRAQAAVLEQRRAEAGAERDDHLDAFAAHDG